MAFDPICYASSKKVFTKKSKELLLELLEAATYTSDMSEKLKELKDTLLSKSVAYSFDIVSGTFEAAVGTESDPKSFILYRANDKRAIITSPRYVNSGETYSFSLGDESANYSYGAAFYSVTREDLNLEYEGEVDKKLGNIITGKHFSTGWTRADNAVTFNELNTPIIFVCNFKRNDDGVITDADIQRLKKSFSIRIEKVV